MDMIERVARAIHENSEPWDAFEIDRDAWLKQARAAITAMREPTEAMLRAEGEDVLGPGKKTPIDGYLDYFDARGVWQAMINAALSSSSEPTANGSPDSLPSNME